MMKSTSLGLTRMLVSIGVVGMVSTVRAEDPPAPPAPPIPSLAILYHADLDGRFAQPDCAAHATPATPDYARLVGLIATTRAAAKDLGDAPPLVLFGGNFAGPAMPGRGLVERGEAGLSQVATMLLRARYDALALGHHDLSLGAATLQGLLDAAGDHGPPVIATNLTCDPARRALCARTRRGIVLKRGDRKVGILATLSPSVLAGVAATDRDGITLDDPATALRQGTQALRAQGATTVVAMIQGPRDQRGLEELDALQRGLAWTAAATTGGSPDLLLVGGLSDDEHNLALQVARREDAPAAVGSRSGAASLARVALPPAGEARDVAVHTLSLPPEAVAPPDPVVKDILAPVVAGYCRTYATPIAPAPLGEPLAFEDFVTYTLEVFRRRADAEIALVNRAAIKHAPFPMTGAITQGHLEAALPYDAVIGVARMNGAAITTALGPALDHPKAAVLGLSKAGGKLLVNGRPIDKARAYRVATIAFVAAGGDAIVPSGALPWRPLRGAPAVRQTVAEALRGLPVRAGTLDPKTAFGPPPDRRLLLVGVSDGGLDIANTRINNGPDYGDAQLTRGTQQVWKAEWTGLLQARHPRHEADARLNLKYGRTRSRPAGDQPSTSSETTDLITFTTVYNYRGLRDIAVLPRRYVPDPYVRVGLESEFTRPAVSATQTRSYRHLELANTAGVLFTLMPALKLRGGGGLRKELLTDTAPFGRWRPLVEAGATLAPTALASFGALAIKWEGSIDYSFVDPAEIREHQVRATSRLSIPLVPLLFVTVGLDVFAVEREQQGWAASYDTTVGLRVHLDAAHQSL